jgi:3-oxoadipate enol-lactonase
VLVGGLDLDAVHQAARRVVAEVTDARLVEWPDVAHLPSMERPEDLLALLHWWLGLAEHRGRP